MEKLLLGKNAIVTGGGAGIGKSIVIALATQGANVAIADISLSAAEQTAQEVRQMGVKA